MSKPSLWDPEEDEFPEGSPFRQTPSLTVPVAVEAQDLDKYDQLSQRLNSVNLSSGTIRGKSPSKSPTRRTQRESELSEFPDWQGTFKSQYGTFAVTTRPTTRNRVPFSIEEEEFEEAVSDKQHLEDDSLREEEQIRDKIAELSDPACGNPTGSDIHDQIMQPFYRSDLEQLPDDYPPRHMHVVNWQAFAHATDRVSAHVRPRLCDAVATVLHATSPECLEQFLDGQVKAFEWRDGATQKAGGLNLVIRREGCTVWVCLYRSHGFKYLVHTLTKSIISLTGRWSEVFGGGRGYILVSSSGPQWHDFYSLHDDDGSDSNDPVFALYMGRGLADEMLRGNAITWEYADDQGEGVQWEVDGVLKTAGTSGKKTLK